MLRRKRNYFGITLGLMALFGVLTMVTSSVRAEIIGSYVDATLTNVATPPEGFGDTWTQFDGLWGYFQYSDASGDFGMDASVFMTDTCRNGGAQHEDPSPITMTVGDLPLGSYEIRLVYVARTDYENMANDIQGKLNDGDFSTYNYSTGESTGYAAGLWEVRQAVLGTVNNATGFSVTVDNIPYTSGMPDTVAIFDGVSYAVVEVPEPSSIFLLLSGVVSFLVWKRSVAFKVLAMAILIATTLTMTILPAQAEIVGTYVDATLTNVAEPTEGFGETWTQFDGLWGYFEYSDESGDFGMNASVFMTDTCRNGGAQHEDPSPITMTVDDLPLGSYEIRLVYVARTDYENMADDIQGKLNDGDFNTYNYSTGESTGFVAGLWEVRQVVLGTIDNATGFSVTVDNIPYTEGMQDTVAIFDGVSYVAVTPERMPGDANGDKKVDGSDVTILAGSWQVGVDGTVEATWEMGDFNGDKKVDGSDVTILAGNWQAGVSASTAAVPEPGTMLLLLSAVGSLLIWRRIK